MNASIDTRDEAERPRYFHLLSDAEVTGLRPVLEVLAEQREATIRDWYDRYVRHFGPSRTLSEVDFSQIYRRDIAAVVDNLLNGDMEGFEADIRELGRDLVDRGVPFAEVVVSLHLFEEAASDLFQRRLKIMIKGPSVYLAFDKLSHCRIILLAASYFAGHQAAAYGRVRILEREASRLAGTPTSRTNFHGLIGASPAMRRVYEQIAASAGGQGAVLLAGESGVGKELVARAIHECAGDADRPFLAVNCAALPRELIESELFGHKKGSYTGALGDYPGLIRAAARGTLFLDEISEMAAETQAKLLRVIEERTVRAVGSPREQSVDVRFIASTNRNPDKAVEAGFLRKDLYYRLAVHRIEIPPLRERVEDIPMLVDHFAERLSDQGLKRIRGLDDEAQSVLCSYAWPGNVRELRNVVEHALTVAKGETLAREDLPPYVLRGSSAPAPDGGAGAVPTMRQAEIDLIRQALEATGGNKLQAARMLRISRHRLYDKLRKSGIET